jgi:hypothetical protein
MEPMKEYTKNSLKIYLTKITKMDQEEVFVIDQTVPVKVNIKDMPRSR